MERSMADLMVASRAATKAGGWDDCWEFPTAGKRDRQKAAQTVAVAQRADAMAALSVLCRTAWSVRQTVAHSVHYWAAHLAAK